LFTRTTSSKEIIIVYASLIALAVSLTVRVMQEKLTEIKVNNKEYAIIIDDEEKESSVFSRVS